MLSIFTLPKPFREHSNVIQRNALQSWRQLRPAPQIILCGRDAGIAEAAQEFGVEHIPDVPCNEYGTPLLSEAFALAQAAARFRLVCYLNADIILLPDFITAVQRLRFERFLMVGQRWNLDVKTLLDFSNPAWASDLRQWVEREGELYPPMGSDYFVFVNHTLGDLLPFAVGRPGWDNWMIYRARSLGMPVVDATGGCMVVHQNHDYRHVRNAYIENRYEGPEADHNLRLMGGNRTRFNLADATHVAVGKRVFPALAPRHLARRVRTLAVLHPTLRPLADGVKRLLPEKSR